MSGVQSLGGVGDDACQSKVADVGVMAEIEQDVGRFQIPVEDVLVVQVVESTSNFSGEAQGVVDGQLFDP